MLLGVISDIHANYEALTAVYDDLKKRGCEKIICAGDIVGYCASPVECIDFIREKEIACIKGNHDAYTTDPSGNWQIRPFAKKVIYWTQNLLDAKRLKWLKNLPMSYNYEGVQFVHASLEALDGSFWPYILGVERALLHFYLQTSKLCFYGHTHIPLCFEFNGKKISMKYLVSQQLDSNPSIKYLLNGGSVGQPRDSDQRAAAVALDLETLHVTSVRTAYDIEAAQKKILDAKLPEILAERLSHGF